jgi:hypothetical protein
MNSMHYRLRQFFPNFASFYLKSVLRYERDMIFFSAVEGLCLANYTHASGERFILFKNPIKFLSYRSLADGLMMAAEIAPKSMRVR